MQMKVHSEILSYFPEYMKSCFEVVNEDVWKRAKEIRIRVGRKIIINCFDKDYLLEHLITTEDILRLIENFSENSLYSFQREINEGFITLKGGHRIGISGTSVFENKEIKNIKYISSLNIRIAREIKSCGKELLDKVYQNNKFENTLIISPPRMWKDNVAKRYC